MTDLPPALLDSPTLPRLVEQLQLTLDDEAERRTLFRQELAPDVKAEFINGEIIMHSPARDQHTATVGRILRVLSTHVEVQSLGIVRFEKALIALTRNDYEPDVCFFGAEKAAGIERRTLEYPAPDLAVEVLSESTAARDRGIKFEDYAAHGVAEYWIVDPDVETVEQYLLDDGRYALHMKSGSGLLEAVAVEGFVVPVRAVFDDAENLDALRALLG